MKAHAAGESERNETLRNKIFSHTKQDLNCLVLVGPYVTLELLEGLANQIRKVNLVNNELRNSTNKYS